MISTATAGIQSRNILEIEKCQNILEIGSFYTCKHQNKHRSTIKTFLHYDVKTV